MRAAHLSCLALLSAVLGAVASPVPQQFGCVFMGSCNTSDDLTDIVTRDAADTSAGNGFGIYPFPILPRLVDPLTPRHISTVAAQLEALNPLAARNSAVVTDIEAAVIESADMLTGNSMGPLP